MRTKNKYLEALETIGKTYTDDCQQISDWEEYKLLQELIDNYSKLEAERNYYVMDNASLIDKNNQLEKALDKACERLKLSFIEKDKCLKCGECYNLKKCKVCWTMHVLPRRYQ